MQNRIQNKFKELEVLGQSERTFELRVVARTLRSKYIFDMSRTEYSKPSKKHRSGKGTSRSSLPGRTKSVRYACFARKRSERTLSEVARSDTIFYPNFPAVLANKKAAYVKI